MDKLLSILLEERISSKVVINVTSGLYKGSYPSRIEDVKDNLVAVSHPLFKNALVPLYRDTILELVMYEKQPPTMIPMKVLRRSMSGNVSLLWLVPAGNPVKIQRRRYARVQCNVDILFFPLSLEEMFPMVGRWEKASCVDISLGGMRLRTKMKEMGLDVGHRVYLWVNLSSENIFLISNIARIVDEGVFREMGLQFEGYPRFVEKRLIRFIRDKELRNAGDGLHD
ncbi:c-di-GMP-binding flagellar brake protein YcgR, contains PilZNR and PilZ domains [Acetomicrobium flavidum]|uniref:C-di-GMP-binding flagellar brake protein YcgR, contains PilZNR and PilZ domains n=1 Tax=Acetomicrobium flavidum TaxID=49896 RepID=A0ABY1JCK2_9BACT|nr:c-di-GMP-binding flagellar brake protein YcgR, contains PilZNR and PilZ domains [Acetomicrobium flavidum]